VAWPLGGEQIVDWGGAGEIVNGRDISVYGRDEDHPRLCAEKIASSQMRKWKFIRIQFTPIAYNPVAGRLTLVNNARIVVQCETDGEGESDELLQDAVMDDLARERFVNFEQAALWYQSAARRAKPPTRDDDRYDYVIITTNAIEAGSDKLDDFVAFKEHIGFDVLVITEDEWGAVTGQAPNGEADKIREWLVDNYAASGIEYVLLIGNPDPDDNDDPSDDIGDLPMKMCWARRHQDDHKQYPTDFFYADLTGNWDLDGDEYYGEFKSYPNGDRGDGGVDFAADVYVGRIPVYEDNYGVLDLILTKILVYQNTTSDISWRTKAFFPMSFVGAGTDGAQVSEFMMDDYLSDRGFTAFKMYQQGTCQSDDDSEWDSDEELLDGKTAEHWADNSYGLVSWFGHGSPVSTAIGYGEDHWCGDLFTREDCCVLQQDKPAIVYQISCNNGYPDSKDNLSYTLLKRGAIGAMGASRVSFGSTPWPDDGPPGIMGNDNRGYEVFKQISVYLRPIGEALAIPKSYLLTNGENRWANAFDFNLYGDPQVHYLDSGMIGDFYVNADYGDDNDDGRSPGSAFKTITHALSVVQGSDKWGDVTIHVAAGTYSATTNGETFPLHLKEYVALIGDDRETTILDAEDSAHHVIFCYAKEAVAIEHFTITGGRADGASILGRGGGIYVYDCPSDMIISDCIITYNYAEEKGGGIYFHLCDGEINNCEFTYNTSNEDGGGLFVYECSPTVRSCSFSHNHAAQDGGGLFLRYSSSELTYCPINLNKGSRRGGGFALYSSDPYIKNCEIQRNWTVTSSGGGMNLQHSSPEIVNCLITHNISASNGGGMYIGASSCPIIDCCTASDNEAAGHGGGFEISGASAEAINTILWGDSPDEIHTFAGGTIDITYSCIEGGYSGYENIDDDPLFVRLTDDVYYLQHSGVEPEDSPCLDAGEGTAADHGVRYRTTCTDGRDDENDDSDGSTGPVDMGYHYDGGFESSGYLDYYVDGVDGDDDDTGAYGHPFKTITRALDAATGHGSSEDPCIVHVEAGTYSESVNGESFPLFIGDHIRLLGAGRDSTTIDAEGGYDHVIYVDYAAGVSIEGFTMTGGDADGSGLAGRGGCMLVRYSSPEIKNCILKGNSADDGGAIYLDHSSPSLTNCLIYENTADSYGGGVLCYASSSPTLTNCTFAENSASDGGGMFCYVESSPTVINTVLWGDSPNELYVSGDSSIDITYSCIEGGHSGTGNIDDDPLFVNLADVRFYLSHSGLQNEASPCVDGGTGTVKTHGIPYSTTAIDGRSDGDDDSDGSTGPIDMGYHYPGEYTGDAYREYYVDTTTGDDSNTGGSWGDAFATIQKGLDSCRSGTAT
ncbi:MAG: DUF1565 domain-containing protein, partial [Candidatus Coatesbacteria bacterium]|nr:DUF1565 domain-containing protein [Candidatus Coatesbacteria bacterium]